jgi:DNA-binding GntR family transcriptional regulator
MWPAAVDPTRHHSRSPFDLACLSKPIAQLVATPLLSRFLRGAGRASPGEHDKEMATPRTSEEIARNHLRSMILQGELPTDVFLSQRWLAERVGVAVVTLRAALRSIEKEGIIENVPRWGVRIPGETEQSIIDRYYLREILEVAAVQRIVQRNDPADAARLRFLAEQCEVLSGQVPLDVNGFAQKHFDFHHTIAPGLET